ncbi:MAG: hypothetical protein OEZ43_12680 [Gammaproteobacteria bacterium]|nr:hypothetical protein [Gammaproteobacteria bacterium]
MSMQLAVINPEDFSKITTERLPHQEIESKLILIGGGGVEGTAFKNKLVKAAGWNKLRLSTYAGNPELAASAFNKIREALAQTENAEELLRLVS